MWVEIIVSVDEAHAEGVSDALMEAGALSVSVEDEWADTESEVPLYGEPGLEPTTHTWQQSRLVVLLEPEADVDALLSEAYGELNLPNCRAMSGARYRRRMGALDPKPVRAD